MADIGSEENPVTAPIEGVYTGTFDGNGKTLYVNIVKNDDEIGVIRSAGDDAVVKNLTVDGNVSGNKYVGGIIGVMPDAVAGTVTVENCVNKANVAAIEKNAAGIVGCVYNESATLVITNCANLGEISGASENGAIAAWGALKPVITNSYNVGTVQNGEEGEIFARRRNETDAVITNCYNLASTGSDRMATSTEEAVFASGEIAYKLGEGWGQTIGTDAYPVLGGMTVYYGYEDCTDKMLYSNEELFAVPTHIYVDGICSVCSDRENFREPVEGVYEVYTIEEYNALVKFINEGNSDVSVKLMADIGSEENPVTKDIKYFAGTFDGNGKSIYIKLDIATSSDPDNMGLGLIKCAGNDTTIKNLTTLGSVSGVKYVGGIVGYTPGNTSGNIYFEKCVNKASVTASDLNAGGILGCCDASKFKVYMTDCANLGTISGAKESAGIAGWVGNYPVIKNCYNTGVVSGYAEDKYAVRAGTLNSDSFTNCYNLNTVATDANMTNVSESAFASGEIAYKLGESWGQTIDTDTHPVLGGEKVYYIYPDNGCLGIYSNTPGIEEPNHTYVDGICTVCGDRENFREPVGAIYEVYTIEEYNALVKFVNDGNSSISVKLMADIGSEENPVTKDIKYFTGTFDGNGKSVYVTLDIETSSDPDNMGLGLIKCAGNNATIKNLTTLGSVSGVKYVGGIVGYTEAVTNSKVNFEKCINKANITATEINGGGILGCNDQGVSRVNMTDCANFGTISGAKENGGLAGWVGNYPTIKNSYNAGIVTGYEANHYAIRVGSKYSNSIENCYNLNTVGTDSNMTNVSESVLASGEIAYKLGESWGQEIGADTYPVLGGLKVYRGYETCIYEKFSYSNSPLPTETLDHTYEEGVCSVCGDIELPADEEGYFLISTKEDLLNFADKVKIKTYLKGRMTNDIDLEGESWTPIASYEKPFTGSFDGNGYAILNLNVSDVEYGGFFAALVNNAVVENLGIKSGSVSAINCAGGIAAYADGDYEGTVTVRGCYNNAEIKPVGSGWYSGGIIGYVDDDVYIQDCYNVGSVEGVYAGGITSYIYSGKITSCYNTGTITGEERYAIAEQSYGIVVENSYYLTKDSIVDIGAESMPAEGFASGEACYKLGDAYGQEIGVDPYPVLGGMKVYMGYESCDEEAKYTNEENSLSQSPAEHSFEGSLCTVCGKRLMEQDEEGFWLINNAEELFKFAEMAELDTAIKGKLMCDIDLKSEKWTPIGSTYSAFTGHFDGNGFAVSNILVATKEDGGFFGMLSDGAIVENLGIESGVVYALGEAGGIAGCIYEVDSSKEEVALVTVRNCYNNASIESNSYAAGGIVGGIHNDAEISQCYNTGNALGDNVGGITGAVYASTVIRNCYNTGEISGEYYYEAGGIAGLLASGYSLTVENCYNIGEIINGGKTNLIGAGENLTVANCYNIYEDTPVNENITKITREEAINGELGYKLGEAYGQKIGEDSFPVIGGEKLYCGYINCEDLGYANSPLPQEAGEHIFEGDVCTLCGHIGFRQDEEGFWLICTYEHMKEFAHMTETDGAVKGKLMKDVSLLGIEWTPMGTYDIPFTGIFDGNGYEISDINVVTAEAGGFFNVLGDGAVVKNLTIASGRVKTVDAAGGIAAATTGDGIVKIINCTNNAEVYSRDDYAGGIIGSAVTDEIFIEECVNTGNVTSDWYSAGGIAGNIHSYEYNGAIRNCYNTGTVYASDYHSGGIAGYAGYIDIEFCYNTGTIISDDYNAAGIVADGRVLNISNCYNTGAIKARANSYNTQAAGISATRGGANMVKNCYNTGIIEGTYTYGISAEISENCYNLEDNGITDEYVTNVSAEQFASGEVAYLLNCGVTDGTQGWYQTIGEDSLPLFEGATVYKIGETYGNIELGITLLGGAQIRIGDGVTDENKVGEGSGIRFVALVDKNDTIAAALHGQTDGDGNAYYGVAIWADKYDESVTPLYIPANKFQDADESVFTAAITNIAPSNYNRVFVAKPYAYYNGGYIYGNEVSRTPYQVASGILLEKGVEAETDGMEETTMTAALISILNAYANETGARITLRFRDNAFILAEAEYNSGESVEEKKAEAFFTVGGENIEKDGNIIGYRITLTGKSENVKFYDYWMETIRINNNNSIAIGFVDVKNAKIEGNTLTFDFYIDKANIPE